MTNKISQKIKDSAKKCLVEQSLLENQKIAHLWVESHRVLSAFSQPGVSLTTKTSKKGVYIALTVKKGVVVPQPIFLCFGVIPQKGAQFIFPKIILEEKAEATILGFCSFPEARKVVHQMKAEIKLGRKAKLNYQEKHYHGEYFGANVKADFNFSLAAGASLNNELILEQGSVGQLDISLKAILSRDAFANFLTKIIGKGKQDNIQIHDAVMLKQSRASSLVKMRGAVTGGGKMIFTGEMIAEAKGTRGHVDCQEIVVGPSLARSVPIIQSSHPEARITHEASVGKVNQKELETLMTRGLSEKEAINFIIRKVIK